MRKNDASCYRYQSAFSLVEILITAALIILLAAMLLPVLGKAKEAAQYTAWRSMSQSLAADPRLALYYNFEDQSGDEINYSGEPIIENKSLGDPMGLVASEESKRGADDPLMRYAAMRESHPDDDDKGFLPQLREREGRFRSKTGCFFGGESVFDDPDFDHETGGRGDQDWALAKEGGYLTPEFWAGVVDKGEFQIGMWIKMEDTLSGQVLCTWGKRSSAPTDPDQANTFVQWATGSSGNGKSTKEKIRALHFTKEGAGGSKWQYNSSDKKHKGIIADNQWHFVVLRLKKPYNTLAKGLSKDPSIPELDDVEMSIDGSPFKRQTKFWGKDDTEDTNRRLEREADAIVFGAAWYSNRSSDNYWNQSRFIRGYIDEILVWQEPTSEREIKQIYKGGAPSGHYPGGFMTNQQAKHLIRNTGRYHN